MKQRLLERVPPSAVKIDNRRNAKRIASIFPRVDSVVDKVASLHKLYDEDGDGLLTRADVCRLEKETADEEVDNESWLALCELVGVANPSADSRWGVAELGRLYALEGGEEELERAWATVADRWCDFSTKQQQPAVDDTPPAAMEPEPEPQGHQKVRPKQRETAFPALAFWGLTCCRAPSTMHDEAGGSDDPILLGDDDLLRV